MHAKKGGIWNELGEREERKSRDKVTNEKRKELIEWLKETGLRIMNGIAEGDEKEDYTYLGTGRHTVIDYMTINAKENEKRKKMEVIAKARSDHLRVKYTGKRKWKRRKKMEKKG